MTHEAEQNAQTQQQPAANQAGTDARGQQGDPGMLGAGGDMANVDRQERAAPVGVPDVPGTANSPGTVSTAGAPGAPSMPKQTDVLGTAGNVRGAEPGNLEPGTPGVPGSPVPAPMGGQLTSDKVPEAEGPQSSSPADMGVGDTPTPSAASGGEGGAATQPRYGTSGTPGLGGARPTRDDDSAQGEPDKQPGDEHVVSDEHGIRSTGPASGTGGSGIERLGGMPGGTPNYGGVGSPGGSTGLSMGRGPGPDSKERGEQGGLGTGGQAVSGSGGPAGTRVLPGGATRPGSAEAVGDGQQDDPVARARQAGDSALNTGPSSTGGTLQRAPGTPGANSASASPYPGMAASDVRPAGGGGTAVPGGQQHEREGKHTEQARSKRPNADEKSGTGMGAAANDLDRGGAETATRARSGGGPTIGGTPPPNGAPPAPVDPDPYGGTISESHADPGFPPPVPEQPTPGLTREPGPEAHT